LDDLKDWNEVKWNDWYIVGMITQVMTLLPEGYRKILLLTKDVKFVCFHLENTQEDKTSEEQERDEDKNPRLLVEEDEEEEDQL